MQESGSRRQPDEEPDKAWLWIVGAAVMVVLVLSTVLYARALACPRISALAPPEIVMFVCADEAS
jgi:hypothetical protein